MVYRILHCGQSLENYYQCVNSQVAGFLNRGAESGDIIYLAVKIGKISYCGVRGTLGDVTDLRPWEDGDVYVHCLKLIDLQFCQPFELKILAQAGGKYWSIKYLQSAKPIRDPDAIALLNRTFDENQQSTLYHFEVEENDRASESEIEAEEIEIDGAENIEEKISIMGTFQTVSFVNETDRTKGLETLVNENFYSLFPRYPEQRTLLIPENRMFLTEGIESEHQEAVTGIRTIPDALMLVYRPDDACPLSINLIEYECYGEQKRRSLEKSNYLNGHIIPQLMKFASTFSVVTDRQIRERTAKKWATKIIDYIYENPEAQKKANSWIREIAPDIGEQRIALAINELLFNAFKTNLQVILVIDELSSEQKSTISNVIKAFKLENGSSINFIGYVVRLEQKIQLIDGLAEYALSVQ